MPPCRPTPIFPSPMRAWACSPITRETWATPRKNLRAPCSSTPPVFWLIFFSARAKVREGGINSENGPAVVADLEKAISLNPQFAPAYATLATFYSMSPDTREKALAAGRKAIELEPGNLNHAVSYGFVLLSMGKTAD